MKDDSRNLVPENVLLLAQFCKAAMSVLNARLLVLLGLLGCAGMFAWAMWQPDTQRTIIACAFAVLVYWPLQRLEFIRREKARQQEEAP